MASSDSVDKFYKLEGEELVFFQKLTEIEDKDELKAHIMDVQRKAFSVFGYNCIRRFAFLNFKISSLPGYKNAFKLLSTQRDPILLDIGCCFGNDTRKAVVDGWRVDQIIASDLRQEFWDFGHELFRSTPESFPAKFIPGDVFNPSMLAPRGPFITDTEISEVISSPTPALSGVANLTPFQGKIAAIHASAFFHLFQEDEQRTLARLLGSLLRPEKGSVIFGQHGSKPEKGFRRRGRGPSTDASVMFCHSPDSWKEMWIKDVFGGEDGRGEERIMVDTELVQVKRPDLLESTEHPEETAFYVMNWCITRI